MTNKIKLTEKELEQIMKGNVDRFDTVFDDIPMYHPDHVRQPGETHRSYVEDDGREYRWFIFKDLQTNEEYYVNYTYNPDWDNDIMDYQDVEIVEKSVLNLLEEPKPVVAPEPVLTPEQKADKELWAKYQAIESETKPVEEKLKDIPKTTIKDITEFLKLGSFNMYQLRAKIIPVCIEYKVEQQSLWQHVQKKAYSKKR